MIKNFMENKQFYKLLQPLDEIASLKFSGIVVLVHATNRPFEKSLTYVLYVARKSQSCGYL